MKVVEGGNEKDCNLVDPVQLNWEPASLTSSRTEIFDEFVLPVQGVTPTLMLVTGAQGLALDSGFSLYLPRPVFIQK